jgi:hypothetical protein
VQLPLPVDLDVGSLPTAAARDGRSRAHDAVRRPWWGISTSSLRSDSLNQIVGRVLAVTGVQDVQLLVRASITAGGVETMKSA